MLREGAGYPLHKPNTLVDRNVDTATVDILGAEEGVFQGRLIERRTAVDTPTQNAEVVASNAVVKTLCAVDRNERTTDQRRGTWQPTALQGTAGSDWRLLPTVCLPSGAREGVFYVE